MAYKEKDTKKWTAQWFETNVRGEKKKRRKRGFETKREALEFERNKKLSDERSMDMKLSEFVEVYFTDKQNELKDRTMKNKKYMMQQHILPYFGDQTMSEIKASQIIQWQNEIQKKGYSDSYLRMIQNQLTSLFTHASKIYERRAEDRYRQCVFCGTSNDFAFLPFDRTGNRRFGPVKVRPEKAEVKVYADEEEARNYIIQAWAESMEIYKSGEYRLTFSPAMEDYVKTLQKEFMPEDTQTGLIQAFLDRYEGDYVCTTIIYQEVFHQDGIVPKWQSKEIGDLLDNEIVGWTKHGNHRFRGALGTQRAWKRNNPKHVALEYKEHNADEAECSEKIDEQMEIPFD